MWCVLRLLLARSCDDEAVRTAAQRPPEVQGQDGSSDSGSTWPLLRLLLLHPRDIH